MSANVVTCQISHNVEYKFELHKVSALIKKWIVLRI